MSRLGYFVSSLMRNFDPARGLCPSCGASAHETVARKYLVTSLRRCSACQLMFRYPTDPQGDSENFYNDGESDGYEQGLTTTLPDDEELETLKKTKFSTTEVYYDKVINCLRAIAPPPARLYDLGCSWGYGSWQIAQAGYEVRSYEISKRRRCYASEKLDVNTDSQYPIDGIDGEFDVFFSNHVLEHLPALADKINAGARYLRPGGTLVAITPNGSEAFRLAQPDSWSKSWGVVHPNLLDDVFYHALAGDRPYFISTTPLDTKHLADWSSGNGEQQVVGDLSRDEIFAAIRY